LPAWTSPTASTAEAGRRPPEPWAVAFGAVKGFGVRLPDAPA
jgi:hypothetical protein